MEINLKFVITLKFAKCTDALEDTRQNETRLGGMSFPELLMRSIHAESTCLLQGHQVRISTYLYEKIFFQSICFEH